MSVRQPEFAAARQCTETPLKVAPVHCTVAQEKKQTPKTPDRHTKGQCGTAESMVEKTSLRTRIPSCARNSHIACVRHLCHFADAYTSAHSGTLRQWHTETHTWWPWRGSGSGHDENANKTDSDQIWSKWTFR